MALSGTGYSFKNLDNKNLRELAKFIRDRALRKDFRVVGRYFMYPQATSYTKLSDVTVDTVSLKEELAPLGIETEDDEILSGIGKIELLRFRGDVLNNFWYVPVDGGKRYEEPTLPNKNKNKFTTVYSFKSPVRDETFEPDKNFPTHLLTL